MPGTILPRHRGQRAPVVPSANTAQTRCLSVLEQARLLAKTVYLGLSILTLTVPQMAFGASNHVLNEKGSLLYEGHGFAVYQRIGSTYNPAAWCTTYGFEVAVEFDVDRDHVFTPEFIYQTLYSSLLPRLKAEHCPQAGNSLSSYHFLRDHFFKRDGSATTRAQAADNKVFNAPISITTYYGNLNALPLEVPLEALLFNYHAHSVHNMKESPERLAQVVGSVNGLQRYNEQGRTFPAEFEAKQAARARIEEARNTVLDKAEKRYGVRLRTFALAQILPGGAPDPAWNREDEWFYIRTYVMTTSDRCGEKTVGEPYRTDLFFARDGQKVSDTDISLWHSARLRPLIKGRQWGSALFGLGDADPDARADIETLLDKNGCGSQPFALIEDYFLRDG